MNNYPFSRTRQAGLSILEVMVASLILAAILAITFSIVASSSAHVETSQITLKMESDAREALNQITKDLRESKSTLVFMGAPPTPLTVTPPPVPPATAPPVLFYNAISFRIPGTELKSYKNNNPDVMFTRRVGYFGELDFNEKEPPGLAGKDDDSNGLIDEWVIKKREVKTDGTGAELPGPIVSTICRFVKKGGLEFSCTSPDVITIKLTLEKTNPKNPKLPKLTKTVETSVDLRN